MEQQRYVGEILVRRGALEEAKVEELLIAAEENGRDLLDLLFADREQEERPIVEALAAEVGIPMLLELKADDVSPELIELVPINFARTHKLLPLYEEPESGRIVVAISRPLDPAPLDDLRALLGKSIEPKAATPEKIEDVINAVYQRKAEAEIGDAHAEEDDDIQDLLDMNDEAPVIRWVNNLFYNASRSSASDIHIEPGEKEVRVRNRIDGKLFPVKSAPRSALASIVSRVKIEAGLNIAEKRLPQDGRITKKIQGRMIDVRVSTIPTARGERIVMRLLDKDKVALDLTDLGFEGGRLEMMHHLVARPNGIILVTGPTGSGKTTTLSACLRHINSPDLNILTAEDPVEYDIAGVGQLQIHPKIGLTFASALRSFLRQDPDVIMVGEIRDHETAEIAIHASLTGHLVLSTLHTNDAAGAVTRMQEMGVQPFLISSSVLAVVAQRLVRVLCKECREAYQPTAGDLRSLGIDADRVSALYGAGVQNFRGAGGDEEEAEAGEASAPDASTHEAGVGAGSWPPPDVAPAAALGALEIETAGVEELGDEDLTPLSPEPTRVYDAGAQEGEVASEEDLEKRLSSAFFFRARGCDACSNTGYRGRLAISEMLIIDEPVRRAILDNSDAASITRIAMARGMRTLREDGARLVIAGTTSLEEVLAATQATELEA